MGFEVRTRADQGDKHSADVNTLIYYKGKLYSGGDDGKIMAWEEDLKKVSEVQAHPTTAFCLAGGNHVIYSCSNDGTVKEWGLSVLKDKGTIFKQESDEIYRVSSFDSNRYSDESGVVRVHEGKNIKNIYNLLEPLKAVIVKGDALHTAKDRELVITEMKAYENFQTIKILNGRAPVCIAGDFLCFSSRGGKNILIHENCRKSDFKLIAEVKDAHTMIINSLVGLSTKTGPFLHSAGWDKMVHKWRIENGVCFLVASVNAYMVVNVLTYGEKGEIYAAGSDGQIIRIDE